MTTSLYDATVPSFLQTLGAVDGFLARGLEHCRTHDIDPQDIVTTRLHPDMLPLWFQIGSTIAHSVGALEGVRRGAFSPDKTPERDYSGLQKAIADARETLKAVSAEEINGFEAVDTKFQLGERTIPFTGANFLLSFSLPNFYFHASMAYGILRARGVPLGKRDFMGSLRIKR